MSQKILPSFQQDQRTQVPNEDLELIKICSQMNAAFQNGDSLQLQRKSESIGADYQAGLKVHQRAQRMRNELHRKVSVLPLQENMNMPTTRFPDSKAEKDPRGTNKRMAIFLDTFLAGDGKEYLLVQAEDCNAFVGCILDNGEYKIIRRIALGVALSAVGRAVGDRLLMGCQNGKVYFIDECSSTLYDKDDAQLGPQHVLEEGMGKGSISSFLHDGENQNVLYVVQNGKQIRRYDLIERGIRKKIEPEDLGKRRAAKVLEQFDPDIKIESSSMIKVVKYIRVGPAKEECLLIYMQGMHLPCILSPPEIKLWFPYNLDRLLTCHNTMVQQVYGETGEEPSRSCPQRVEGISIAEYQLGLNKLVLGCIDGTVYLCSILQFQQKMALDGFNLSIRPFDYLVEREMGFREGNQASSICILAGSCYICVATESKVLFYDVESRTKFSPTLKQKTTNPINCVKWAFDSLLLCCLHSSEAKVYLYSKELPIRAQ